MPKIIVVGSANMDLVTRVPRCPRPGETLLGSGFATVPGGKGANQAVAAARLGAETCFVGCVGEDAFGEMQRGSLAAEGIRLDSLKTHPTEPTGTAVILVADEGQNSIVVTQAANMTLTPGDIEAMDAVFEGSDAVLVQLEIRLDTAEAALDAARRHGALGILDVGVAQPVPESLLHSAALVSPNETEAEAITGITADCIDRARDVAARLRDMGAERVVLKLGDKGALYMDPDHWLHVRAFTVRAVDTTAAGDAFTAALAVVWKERSPRHALEFANAAGALAATVAGAQPSMPTRDAVETFLRQQGHGYSKS